MDASELPLRDIHLPEAVSWWPPAPGWWALLLVGLALLGFALWRRHRYRAHRAALGALARIEAALGAGTDPVSCMQSLSAVLRRFVMTVVDSRELARVPGLTGAEWLEYLDARSAGARFEDGVGRLLLEAPYAPPHRVSADDARALTRLCVEWVRAQRPGGR